MKELNLHAMYYGMFLSGVFILSFLSSTFVGSVFVGMQFAFILLEIYLVRRFAIDARERVLGGDISYLQGFVYIVRLFLYSSMILAFFKYVYFTFINPDFLKDQFELASEVYSQLLSSADMSDVKAVATSGILVSVNTVWYNLLLGTVLGLLMSGTLKRKDNHNF